MHVHYSVQNLSLTYLSHGQNEAHDISQQPVVNDEDKEGEGYDKGQLGQEGQGHVQHAQLGVVLGEDLLLPDDGDDEGVANQTEEDESKWRSESVLTFTFSQSDLAAPLTCLVHHPAYQTGLSQLAANIDVLCEY